MQRSRWLIPVELFLFCLIPDTKLLLPPILLVFVALALGVLVRGQVCALCRTLDVVHWIDHNVLRAKFTQCLNADGCT